jgi:hypothetical protein
VGQNDGHAIGFIQIGRHFSQKFAIRNPSGSRQLGRFFDAAAYFLRDQRSRGQPHFGVCNIQVSFVQGKRLHQIRIIIKNSPNLFRHRLVCLKTMGHKNQMRAQLLRFCARHGRSHPVFSRFITGRRHHAPRPSSPYRNRFAPPFRMVPLLYRRKKSVHVNVDDLSQKHALGPPKRPIGLLYCGGVLCAFVEKKIKCKQLAIFFLPKGVNFAVFSLSLPPNHTNYILFT